MSKVLSNNNQDFTVWRGIEGLSSMHKEMFQKVLKILGQENMIKLWELYIETGLINKDGSLWGDKNADGTSKGPIPHSLTVALSCYVLAEKLGLFEKSHTLLLTGLAHDAYKRWEMEKLTKLDDIILESSKKIRLLYGDEVAYLSTISSHSSMAVVVEKLGDTVMEVFYWADNAVVGATLQPVSVKSDYLEASARNGRYPFNDEGIAYWGVPYFTFQRYLGSVIEASISRKLGIVPTTLLYKQVEKWIAELA